MESLNQQACPRFDRRRKRRKLLLLSLAFLLVLPGVLTLAHRAGFDEKIWSGTAPTMDGVNSSGEWCGDSPEILVPSADDAVDFKLSFKWDVTDDAVYILFDRDGWIANAQNYAFIAFDTDHDGGLDPDAGDKAVELYFPDNKNAVTPTWLQGSDSTSGWSAGSDWGWTFSRDNNGVLEMKVPLSSINLNADGTMAGFYAVTCDKQNSKEVIGWPTDNEITVGNCTDIASVTSDPANFDYNSDLPAWGDAQDPSQWGTLERTSDTFAGACEDDSIWGWSNITDDMFINYTYRADQIQDWETSHDPSNGGAAVQPDNVDISSGTLGSEPGGHTSVQYAFYDPETSGPFTCGEWEDDIVVFRLWLEGDPRLKDASYSRHWNVLFDIDGDGYKEFWIDIDGTFSQTSSDVVRIYYEDSDSQDILDPDTALKYMFPADNSGADSSYVRYGEDTTREGTETDYYIDVRIPIKYLNLAANDGTLCCDATGATCEYITSTTPLRGFYSTSASNTNPLQKDWMGDPCGLSGKGWTTDMPICFGDEITFEPGSFLLTPLSYNEVVGPGTILNYAHKVVNIDGGTNETYTMTASGCAAETVNIYYEGLYDATGTDPKAANINGIVDTGDTGPITLPYTTVQVDEGEEIYFVIEVIKADAGESCTVTMNVTDGTDTKTANDTYTVDNDKNKVLMNELMYDPLTGDEWLELSNTSPFYPVDIGGWEISDNDGHTYTIPAGITLPSRDECGDEARVLIIFDGSNAADTSDSCLVKLYPNNTEDWFENDADDVSLCAGTCSGDTIVDYVAYGSSPGNGDADALLADIWTNNTYVPTDDLQEGDSLSRLRNPDYSDGYDTNDYTDWYPANAPSPGEENTPNIVINEVEIDGGDVSWAELYVFEDGIGGTGGVDISGYNLSDVPGSAGEDFSTSPITVTSGDYVRIHWGGAGTDDLDSQWGYNCPDGSTCTERDISLAGSAPVASSDNELILSSGLQYLDAVTWDPAGAGNTSAATLNGYSVNGLNVPMWNSSTATDAVNISGFAALGTTFGRDAQSTDTNSSGDWDSSGGADAVGETPYAQNVGVIINEVMFKPSSGDQWVELYCGTAIDFSSTPYHLELEDGTAIDIDSGSCSTGGYLAINAGSSLSQTADSIRLCAGDSSTACSSTTIRDFLAYGGVSSHADDAATDYIVQNDAHWTENGFIPIGGIAEGESIGRDMSQTDTNSVTDWDMHGGADAVGPTYEAQNIGEAGQLIFNEVMFHADCSATPVVYPWVEIYNPTDAAVNAYGYRIEDGDGNYYLLPDDPTDTEVNTLNIPAGSFLVVVFDNGGSSGSDDYDWTDDDGYGEIHANLMTSSTDPSDCNLLDTTDVLSVCSSSSCTAGTIQDFIAWGAAPTSEDDIAVSAGIWDSGDYIPTGSMTFDVGESLGRDKDQTDTNQPADWDEHGGADAVNITPGNSNIGNKVIINEVSIREGGAGGNSDWVEIFNPTDEVQILTVCLSLDDGSTCAKSEQITLQPGGLDPSDPDAYSVLTGLSLSETSGALSLYVSTATGGSCDHCSSTTIMDFIAYGAAPDIDAGNANTSGSGYDASSAGAGIWDSGDYIDTATLIGTTNNETFGRNASGADTNQPSDWSDTGGIDVTETDPSLARTYGTQNFLNPEIPLPPPGPTYVVISDVKASLVDGKVVIEWETSTEIDTIGFYIERLDEHAGVYRRVKNQLLPAFLNSMTGGTYRVVDAKAQPGKLYRYRLLEVESSGKTNPYGPFQLSAPLPRGKHAMRMSRMTREHVPEKGFTAKAHQASAKTQARLAKAELSRLRHGRVRGKSQLGMAIKISVTETGLYALDAAQLAELFGVSLKEVQRLIRTNSLVMRNQGKDIAWKPMKDMDGLYFYGKKIDSIYTEENIYWVTPEKGNGLVMETVEKKHPLAPVEGLVFTETAHREKDRWPLLNLAESPYTDFWFWDYLAAGLPWIEDRKTYSFKAPGLVYTSEKAELTLRIAGTTNTDAELDHHVSVFLNGTHVGDGYWGGLSIWEETFLFESELLSAEENTLEIQAKRDTGAPYSIVYLDAFDIRYPRLYLADSDRLQAPANGNPVLTVGGFRTDEVLVFDISVPEEPRFLARPTMNVTSDDAYQVSFAASGPDAEYLVVGKEAILRPDDLIADSPSTLKQETDGADYLIITPGKLQHAAQVLADYRRDQGLKSMVVDLEDIYDEFSDGMRYPEAIKQFLSYAYCRWSIAPRYVILAGEGTYDYKDTLGSGDNLIPTVLIKTPDGLFASDNWFADLHGDDGIPEIAVGRFPVISEEELYAQIEKIKSYESNFDAAWRRRVLLTADLPDVEDGNFPADSNDLSTLLPPTYQAEKIFLSDFSIADARQALLNTLHEGVFLLNYIGHGSVTRLSADGLLTTNDIDALSNTDRMPIVAAMTCAAGQFAIPGFDSLAEKLILKADGGAAAVWAPSGLSYNEEAVLLNKLLFNSMFERGEMVLGEIILDALEAYGKQGGELFMLRMYNIFGDPALRLGPGAYTRQQADRGSSVCERWNDSEPERMDTVTIRKTGNGKGTLILGTQKCGLDCRSMEVPYAANGRLLLKAIPAEGSIFVGWWDHLGARKKGSYVVRPGDVVIAKFKKITSKRH